MSFPEYPECKHSGFEWLGKIPSHWRPDKFRYVFVESGEKIDKEVVGEMLSVSGYRGIEVKTYDDENKRRTNDELQGYRIVRPGQLVVNTMWLNYAGLGVSDHKGHVSPAYRSYWIAIDVDLRFIHHLMRSSIYVQGYTQLLTGIRPNSLQMSRDDLMAFPVLLAPKAEQTQIARFVDHETAKIDALIQEQERLIELLQEKRQAVISHAVTKGLNPDVPMKDSGVESIGKVPTHWTVLSYRRFLGIMQGLAFSSNDYVEQSDTVSVRMGNIKKSGIVDLEHNVKYLPDIFADKFRKYLLKEGDLIIAMTDMSPSLDFLAIPAEFENGDPGCQYLLNQRVGKLHLSDRVDKGFVKFCLLSMPLRHQLKEKGLGTVQANMSNEDLFQCFVALPPLSEQRQISDSISRRLGSFDNLLDSTQSLIQLLSERRSALISAAVTGKIDVRNWQPPADESVFDEEVRQAGLGLEATT